VTPTFLLAYVGIIVAHALCHLLQHLVENAVTGTVRGQTARSVAARIWKTV
jgi:hypothetical protein